jgi:hypothetical protein
MRIPTAASQDRIWWEKARFQGFNRDQDRMTVTTKRHRIKLGYLTSAFLVRRTIDLVRFSIQTVDFNQHDLVTVPEV